MQRHGRYNPVTGRYGCLPSSMPTTHPKSHQSDRIILHGDIISCRGRRLSLFGLWLGYSGIPARDALECGVLAVRPPTGWRRPLGRPRQTWLHHIGDGYAASIRQEWVQSDVDTGHSRQTRSAIRAYAAQAPWWWSRSWWWFRKITWKFSRCQTVYVRRCPKSWKAAKRNLRCKTRFWNNAGLFFGPPCIPSMLSKL